MQGHYNAMLLLKAMLNWLLPKPRLLGTNAQMKSFLAKATGEGSMRQK